MKFRVTEHVTLEGFSYEPGRQHEIGDERLFLKLKHNYGTMLVEEPAPLTLAVEEAPEVEEIPERTEEVFDIEEVLETEEIFRCGYVKENGQPCRRHVNTLGERCFQHQK